MTTFSSRGHWIRDITHRCHNNCKLQSRSSLPITHHYRTVIINGNNYSNNLNITNDISNNNLIQNVQPVQNVQTRHISQLSNNLNSNNWNNSNYLHNHNHSFHSSSKLYCAQAQEMKETNETQEKPPSKVATNPKIEEIVNVIASLNLLEVSELVAALKQKLNLPDSAMMGAPMMMAAPGAAGAPGAPGAAPAAEEEEPQREQTIFEVILKGYKDDAKIAVVKEVRQIFQLGLKEAKSLVEKAPVTLASNCPKVDAEAYRDKLSAIGAEINLE